MPWEGWSEGRNFEDMFARIDEALALLEAACRSETAALPAWGSSSAWG